MVDNRFIRIAALSLLLAACSGPQPGPVVSPGPAVNPDLIPVHPGRLPVASQRRQEQLIASGMKPFAASEIGFYLDLQEGRLRQQLGPAGFTIERRPDSLALNLAGYLAFESESDRLLGEALRLLESIAAVLAEFDRTLISVHGYTDNSGPESYNQQLSERRAQSIARQLGQWGVALNRLLVVGHGESDPIADNNTEQGQLINRRIEIVIYPVRSES